MILFKTLFIVSAFTLFTQVAFTQVNLTRPALPSSFPDPTPVPVAKPASPSGSGDIQVNPAAPTAAPTPPPAETPPGTPTPTPTPTPTTFQDAADISKAAGSTRVNTDPLAAPSKGPSYPKPPVVLEKNKIVDAVKTPDDRKLFATLSTSMGNIRIKLFSQYAPKTVKNFTDLATGQKEFVEVATSRKSTRPFYNGQIIFKVVRDFVIQMGCPFGDGRGGPGYEIPDEFSPYLLHNKPGIVSMANHGSNTGGSQFFITLGPQPSFDNKYSIFGEVVSGMDVVTKISKVKTGPTSRPLKRIVIQKIDIEGKLQ